MWQAYKWQLNVILDLNDNIRKNWMQIDNTNGMKKTWLSIISFLLISLFLFLQGCASSNVTREANDNAAVGYENASSSIASLGNGSIADSYANTSQAAKGAIVGGVAGAATGSLIHGVGLVPGLAVGAILGGAYGAYIDSNISSYDQLENRGVKMIVLGDHIMVVIPSDHLFNSMTPVIKPGAYSTLDLIAAYINKNHTMTVKVTAYTSSAGSERVNLALSKEQAESIVRYLWQKNINTRMMTAIGMGGTHPVMDDTTGWSSNLNYRIEITMEKMPVTDTLG